LLCEDITPEVAGKEFWSWFESVRRGDFRVFGFLQRSVADVDEAEAARENASVSVSTQESVSAEEVLDKFRRNNRVQLRDLAEALDYEPSAQLLTSPIPHHCFRPSFSPARPRTLTRYASGSQVVDIPKRHPEESLISIGFREPVAYIAGRPSVVACRITGLVRGVAYRLALKVAKGYRSLFEDEFLLDNVEQDRFVLNVTVAGLAADVLGCPADCLPMQPISSARIRMSIWDRFPGLVEKEALLSAMGQRLKVHSFAPETGKDESKETSKHGSKETGKERAKDGPRQAGAGREEAMVAAAVTMDDSSHSISDPMSDSMSSGVGGGSSSGQRPRTLTRGAEADGVRAGAGDRDAGVPGGAGDGGGVLGGGGGGGGGGGAAAGGGGGARSKASSCALLFFGLVKQFEQVFA
jgi:hypothetical protein